MGKQRFRQVHLDFHTSEHIPAVGDQFDAEEFARTLKEAHVNQINLFAKCHHGWMYYASEKFRRHPGLKCDLLDLQLEACRRHDIVAPIYITAGWDELAAREHPEWWERTPDGRPYGAGPLQASWRKLCLNSPYVDLLEEQILDIHEHFKPNVDGWWIDIVFQNSCCCNTCMSEMLANGLDPENEEDRVAQSDLVLRRFKKRFTDLLKPMYPNSFIFYNAGHVGPYIRRTIDTYTHLELESLPGGRDHWGYEHFPITARFARTLGLEFLGMTGKFHKIWGDFGGFKSQPALEYECFRTLAVGAKCCVGDQLHPSGKICKATYDLIGKVYAQMKEKEPWCDDTEGVVDIGIFTPESPEGTRHHGLDPSIRGAHRLLEENHYQFDVIDAESDFTKYRLIIMPDSIRLDDNLRAKTQDYLSAGGKLLLSYESGLWIDSDEFALDGVGATMRELSDFNTEYFAPREALLGELPDARHVLYDRGRVIEPARGTEILADLWQPYFNRDYRHFCSHFQTPPEKPASYPEAIIHGQIGYLAHPIFMMIRQHGARVYKQLANALVRRLLPDPVLISNAPTTAIIHVMSQPAQNRTIVHILHYIPEARSRDVDVIEDIIPIFDVQVALRLQQKPARVYLAPSEQDLECVYESGRARVTLPKVTGHEMVVFQM